MLFKKNIGVWLVLLSISGLSQDYSRWKSHLPNKYSSSVAFVDNSVFVGGPQTFFSYNIKNSSIDYYSKIKGFSGSSIDKLAYDPETNTTIICYENSTIDLVNGTSIIPVLDIFKSNLLGSRKVNNIFIFQGKAYLSTDYGLVIFNLKTRIIEDVCKSITSQNTPTIITSSTILNDSIYVASDKGIFVVSALNSVNRLDYRNWKLVKTNNISPNGIFFNVASVDNRVFMATANQLFVYENGNFVEDPALNVSVIPKTINLLKTIGNKVYILQANTIFEYYSGTYKNINNKANAQDICVDNTGQLWVSDISYGLVMLNGSEAQRITTNGPFSNLAFHLYPYLDKMMILTGGYNYDFYGSYFNSTGFSLLDKDGWRNYNIYLGNIPYANDLSSASYNSISNKLYIASYGNGLMEWDLNTQKFKVMNHFTPGVPLKYTSDFRGDSLSPSSNRVPDVAVDNNGTVWVLNTPNPNVGHPSVYKYDLNGRWDSVVWSGTDRWNSYNYSSTSTESYYLHRIFIDRNNNKWMASRYISLDQGTSIGLFVYNESKHGLPRHLKYEKDKFNEICGEQVYCITQDLDGAVWIGTDNGICYFSDPEEVFQQKKIKATTPIINNQPLLKGIRVTGIDFDGSNRKWISTSGEGLLLVSPDGTKILNRFNEDNSPLLSKDITDVKVNKVTGEVFVATNSGVFSYNGFSILGADENQDVIAYPNPIKKEFSGYFTLDGLVNKAIVKITDITGNLVYESKAEGSRFTWNVHDYNGNRPKSGVYLIYTSKEDGSNHLMTKIAILD